MMFSTNFWSLSTIQFQIVATTASTMLLWAATLSALNSRSIMPWIQLAAVEHGPPDGGRWSGDWRKSGVLSLRGPESVVPLSRPAIGVKLGAGVWSPIRGDI